MSLSLPNRPQWDHLKVLNILGLLGVTEKCALLGVRGYFRDSQGKPGVNDREIYDDALFLVGPNGYFRSFNFNCDPNGFRKGHGTGSSHGMASLKPGVYRVHIRDIHGGSVPHRALCERRGKVTVYRDADASVPADKILHLDGFKVYEDTGNFGINIHRGGANSTSSLGCQTVPPSQWAEFFGQGVDPLMDRAQQTIMPYALIAGVG